MMVEVLHVVNGTTDTHLFQAEHVTSQMFKSGKAILKFKGGEMIREHGITGPVLSAQYSQAEVIIRFK